MVAAASIDRIVHVWSTQTHKLLHRLDGHTESVYALTFSHDGNTLVSGGLDKTIKVRTLSISISIFVHLLVYHWLLLSGIVPDKPVL